MNVAKDQKAIIFDVPIDDMPIDELIQVVEDACKYERKIVVAYTNIHALNIAYKDLQFRQFVVNADIVFCDGFGVKWGGRLLGFTIKYRYTPPDWIDILCARLKESDRTFFFLGAEPGVAQAAANHLIERHPGLQIVGCHNGFFNKKITSAENKEVVALINQLKPNVLVVGFGMPLQEYWLKENWSHIDANVAIPVGAMFDYVAQTIPRAPRWMTDNGFEWLGRFFIEPKRLWRRYLIGNPKFFFRVLKYRFATNRMQEKDN